MPRTAVHSTITHPSPKWNFFRSDISSPAKKIYEYIQRLHRKSSSAKCDSLFFFGRISVQILNIPLYHLHDQILYCLLRET